MKKFLLFISLAVASPSFAQSLWSDLPESSISVLGERRIVPTIYRTVWLNLEVLQPFLANVPERFSPEASDLISLPVLTLPTPDGRMSRFRLTESPVMAPELQAGFPDIRCYTGYGLDDPTAFLKCDLTPWGFHAMVFSSEHGVYSIDPYSHGDRVHYVVYYKKDYPLPAGKTFVCETEENISTGAHNPGQSPDQGSCTLKSYRLALACTGEYATFHGGTKALALAAMNTSLNRVNGVYELEVAVTMSMVPNDTAIIYLNAATDPYTNNNGGTMLGQNQTTCTNVIGTANYDIGHVYSTGGGGVANLSCVCSSGNKAKGVTGSSSPVGDNFDIDYVAHEMGHQFAGNHTFNGTAGSCSGNVNAATRYEPGSGSTIMAYAGICSYQDIQPHSDAYFHAISLQEIGNFTATGAGNNCDLVISSSNGQPTVNGGIDRVIPKSTPFTLTAVGTDPNNNPLTYNWEQMDNQASTQPPVATSTGGPNFRSFTAISSPERTFPELSAIISNTTPTWEVLPSVGRTLNFRVSVRDIGAAYGCTGEDNVVVTVNGTAGPFQVTSPNTGLTWKAGFLQTITWNVAGTTANSVNCANVKISLSTDGGYTYPVVVLASTPNDGTEEITVPAFFTTTARVRIEAVGNVFFDISDADFAIVVSLPVELADFQARLQGQNTALLSWSTATETTNRGFEIELKQEGDADFQTVGFQAGKGTTTQPSKYQYTIPNLGEGSWYFRLKQLDVDGKATYSPLRSLRVQNRFSVQLFPNPVQSDLNLIVFQEQSGPVTFEVVNELGQRFDLLSAQPLDKGYTNLHLPVDLLPAGVYAYWCRSENGLQQGKIVVERR
ncbi:MAG: reprolysin-like metallopeptidase [Saprospiraceae bacterium]